jgi:hypothetical protein
MTGCRYVRSLGRCRSLWPRGMVLASAARRGGSSHSGDQRAPGDQPLRHGCARGMVPVARQAHMREWPFVIVCGSDDAEVDVMR